MTQRYDFTIEQGSDFAALFVCSTTCSGTFDLHGYMAEMQIRQGRFGAPVDELTSENGRLEIDVERSAILMKMPHSCTEKYPCAQLLYDIEITSSEGERHRILQGVITVSGEITR